MLAFQRELISEGELARLLRTDRLSARDTVIELSTDIELAEDGTLLSVPHWTWGSRWRATSRDEEPRLELRARQLTGAGHCRRLHPAEPLRHGVHREIIPAWPARFAVVAQALAEVRYMYRGGSGPDARERIRIDLEPLVTGGLPSVIHVAGPAEEALLVEFAAHFDDGDDADARACALAVSRGAAVASDDGKVQRILSERLPPVPIVTTSQLVKQWTEVAGLDQGGTRAILTNIRERASFAPPRRDPLRSWWIGLLSG